MSLYFFYRAIGFLFSPSGKPLLILTILSLPSSSRLISTSSS